MYTGRVRLLLGVSIVTWAFYFVVGHLPGYLGVLHTMTRVHKPWNELVGLDDSLQNLVVPKF
jgi:hypothetical protein